VAISRIMSCTPGLCTISDQDIPANYMTISGGVREAPMVYNTGANLYLRLAEGQGSRSGGLAISMGSKTSDGVSALSLPDEPQQVDGRKDRPTENIA